MAVTALGLASSLSFDAVSSCAAARAGLVRATMVSLDPDLDEHFEPQIVSCHTLRSTTEGFTGQARLLRIGAFALRDLMDSWQNVSSALPSRLGMIVNLPSNYYEEQERRQDEQQRAEEDGLDGPVNDAPSPDAHDEHDTSFVDALIALADVSVAPKHKHVTRHDQAGFASALATAREWLDAGRIDACIVGGVDSLADDVMLDRCARLGVLKTNVSPVGFMPGEGAAFVLVQNPEYAARTKVPIQAMLGAVKCERDPTHRFSEKPADGSVLAHVVAAVAQGTDATPKAFYCGLNGDTLRATDWGVALVRLRRLGIVPSHEVLLATTFGELGAAYGFVAICAIARSFARTYARSNTCVLWAASDSGLKAALAVSSPPTEPLGNRNARQDRPEHSLRKG